MDGGTLLLSGCLLAGGCWLIGGATILLGRVRGGRPEHGAHGVAAPSLGRAHARGEPSSAPDTRVHLERGLRSREPDVRRAAVVALGRLGQRHDWAVDGLIEALAERRDAPAFVAAQLDALAPRADARLLPLLGHPESSVRYYAARLLARDDEVGREYAHNLTSDPSPHVRAAALESLQRVGTGAALRRALQLLEDPHPLVRAQACKVASALSAVTAVPCVAPLLADASWDVREAARAALVAAGRHSTETVARLLEHDDPRVRSLAALVLSDSGCLAELAEQGRDSRLLERALLVGGRRLRALTAERAGRQVHDRAVRAH